MKLSIRSLILVAAGLLVLPAWAQNVTISGSVTDMDGAAINGTVEVHAYQLQANGGYAHQTSTMVNNLGQYSLSVPAPATYKIFARVGIVSGCPTCNRTNGTGRTYQTTDARYWRTSRWHPGGVADTAWTEEQAQTLTVSSGTNVSDINFRMPLAGAVQGRILAGGSARAGMLIRVERTADFRRHHNAVSLANLSSNRPGDDLRLGRFWVRGLVTGTDHRIIVHDPDGNYETFVQAGTFSPTAQNLTDRDDIMLSAYNANPYGSNNSLATAFDVLRSQFGGSPLSWTSSGARIAPINSGARDWFCWDVYEEERFYVTATTQGTIQGLPSRYSPWVNPRLRVVNAASGNAIHSNATDEYSGPGPMDAEVDTGRIANDGRYCAVVTTVGDSNFNGAGQQSAGRYVLRIHMGNRPPFVDVTHGTEENPAVVVVEEGGSISLGVTYGDPDGDAVSISSTFVDDNDNPVSGATFNPSGGSGTWSWDVPVVAAPDSPYYLTFTVQDGEFTTIREVRLDVAGVNFPPTEPTPISPDDGAVVTTLEPTLTIGNSTDPDGDPIRYEFEVYYANPSGGAPADESYTDLSPGGGGETSLVVGPLPEKYDIWWRARAYDVPAEPPTRYSDWTDARQFFVHAVPPYLEPSFEGEPVTDTLVVEEGDTVVVDLDYGAPNGTAPDVTCELLDGEGNPVDPQPVLELNETEGTGTWTWGVGALDSANGPFSLSCVADDGRYETAVDIDFEVDPRNLPPTAPTLVSPDPDTVLGNRTPTLVATNAVDPEGEATFMHFQVARDAAFDEIVAATPSDGVPQDEVEGQTGWTVDTPLEWATEYWFRAFATDVHGLAGPYSGIRRFEMRENSPPNPSQFDGDLGAQCTGGVVESSPMTVSVVPGTDPDGDLVSIHLQIFPYEADPADGILVDLLEAAHTEDDVTDILVDVSALPDNARYTIRVRTYDGSHYSAFNQCDFWLNIRNESPTALSIIEPEPGTVLPVSATTVDVVVQNAWDPDLVVPGTSLELAYCATLDSTFADCPELHVDWDRVPQSSYDPEDTTTFTVGGLTPRERWNIRVCAIDETGLCGPADDTYVLVGDGSGGDDGTGGCCTTARGGEPWMAFFAVLALVLMAPRRRRRRA